VFHVSQVSSLSGIQTLTSLVDLNVSNTQIVADSLLCLQGGAGGGTGGGVAPTQQLRSLNISLTDNVEGDTALQYLAGQYC